MANKTMKSVALFFCEGSSDKVYNLQINEGKKGEFTVDFSYGRRGSALKTGTKTLVPISLGAAEQVYAKFLKEKLGKGYQESGAEAPSF